MLSNFNDLQFSNKLTERANNHRKIHASHGYIKQNAKFLPLNFYVVQMLNTQLEFLCEVAPFFGGHGWFIPV